jgi:serine phosphatase RsbU (regulator of sigma subunit)
MGHGVRAALITAMLRALIETHVTEAADPTRFLTKLNNEFTAILKQTGTVVFATVLYSVINVAQREARFACAGHPPPLHARRTTGEVNAAFGQGCGGPAMGLIPDAQFRTAKVKLTPGDFLLFFTDGIIEVEDQQGGYFGLEGLQRSVRANLEQSTESLLESIIDGAHSFADSEVFADDVCLVAAEL